MTTLKDVRMTGMSAKEDFQSLQQIREASTLKHAYFLLATAAAAIAFAVQRTSDRPLTCSMWPLGGAVLAWGYSFFCGCFLWKKLDNLRVVEQIYLNHVHKRGGTAEDAVVKARSERVDELAPKFKYYGDAQFYSL